MEKEEGWLEIPKIIYAAHDESNHGNRPEIHALVWSYFLEDIEPPQKKNKLKNRGIYAMSRVLFERNYSFLEITDKKFYESKEWLSIVLASLLKGIVVGPNDSLCLFLDGEYPSSQTNIIKPLLSQTLRIKKSQISLKNGRNFDEKYKIVSLADYVANYFFRHNDERIRNPHRKNLLDILCA